MDCLKLAAFLRENYADLIETPSWGEQSFFYNPASRLPRGVYFLTLKTRNGPHDVASQLDRADVFRVNFGISKRGFIARFAEIPARPAAGKIVAMQHDFTRLDTLTPHPVYGWMAWVSVLKPSEETLDSWRPLLDESYALAVSRFRDRVRAQAFE